MSQAYCTFPANWNIVFCECKSRYGGDPKKRGNNVQENAISGLIWNMTFLVVYNVKKFSHLCVGAIFLACSFVSGMAMAIFPLLHKQHSRGVPCAHGHKGKAAKCQVWPIMAYAHSGPMYLAFWPQRPAGCWFTSTARTVGVITKTFPVYKYKQRSDLNTRQPEPQKGSNFSN